jgi:hypothetical protein
MRPDTLAKMLYFAYGSNMCAGRLLRPYSWYKRFVVEGARQHGLPADYIAGIEALPAAEDPDQNRDVENRATPCNP